MGTFPVIPPSLADNLPTNFAVANMVEELTAAASAQAKAHRRTCSSCEDVLRVTRAFICVDCDKRMVCAFCALQMHGGHELRNLNEAIEGEQARIEKWINSVRVSFCELVT